MNQLNYNNNSNNSSSLFLNDFQYLSLLPFVDYQIDVCSMALISM